MDLSAPEAQCFNFPVLFYLQPHGIEIRQLMSACVLFPIVGIPFEQDVRAGFMLSYIERSQSCHFFQRRRGRKNRDCIKEVHQVGYWRGEDDFYLSGRDNTRGNPALAGAEGIAHGAMECWVHQLLHGIGHVRGRKWRAVRETGAGTYLEANALAAVHELPVCCQLRLRLLGDAVHAHQNAAGEVRDGFGLVVLYQQRIQRLGLSAETETQLTAALRPKQRRGEEQGTSQKKTLHARTSCLLSKVWKLLTTTMRTIRGTNCQGSGRNVTTCCNSRKRLPRDGSGSDTPNPNTPKLASAMMNTGIEIQNCASKVPRRLGSRCSRTNLKPEKPVARASQTNSDFIMSLVPAQITRAEAAQPSNPKSVNVSTTEASGEMFKGRTARTVIRRKSHGIHRNKSTSSMRQRSIQPPK